LLNPLCDFRIFSFSEASKAEFAAATLGALRRFTLLLQYGHVLVFWSSATRIRPEHLVHLQMIVAPNIICFRKPFHQTGR
jgi:hypothetical protein